MQDMYSTFFMSVWWKLYTQGTQVKPLPVLSASSVLLCPPTRILLEWSGGMFLFLEQTDGDRVEWQPRRSEARQVAVEGDLQVEPVA